MSSNYAMNQNFDSDDEDNKQQFQSTQDGTIFLIDCAASMFVTFEEDDETTCLFTKCLLVLERLLMNRIISGSKSLVSLYFKEVFLIFPRFLSFQWSCTTPTSHQILMGTLL